jgi:hypothetical protein
VQYRNPEDLSLTDVCCCSFISDQSIQGSICCMFISVETKWKNISGIFVPKDEAKKTVFHSAL